MAAAMDISTADYDALTRGCGLVDRSERGKLALTGSEAKPFLNGQVTNDVEALEPGTGCYAAFLTPKAKMLGDLRILDAGGELLLDTERVSLQALFDLIRRFRIGYDAELHKRTLERGLLSLVGPRAREIAGAADLPRVEHAHRRSEVGGAPVRLIVAAGGIDVLCDAGDAGRVREALVAAGAQPVDEASAEVVRVEAGRPRYGVDLDDATIPQEAGLNDRAVSFTKGCYVGQETVARLFYRGKPNRHLRGLRLSAPAPAGTPVRLGEREVGRLGTVVHSPVHGPIALAIVRREAAPGDTLAVGDEGVSALVVELPF
jgi:folate-binding protein YgfZ